MKKLSLLFIFLINTALFSQEKTFQIDYTVDYEVLAGKRKDTLSLGFNKEGRFLWTNHHGLATKFAKSMIKNEELVKNAKINLFFDTKTKDITMLFTVGGSDIYFNINAEMLLNKSFSYEESDVETTFLITEPLDVKETFLGKQINNYEVYPEKEPEETLYVGTSKEYAVSNDIIFKSILDLINLSSSKEHFSVDFPNELILVVNIENKDVLKAFNINNKKKIFTLNHSFKISE